MPTKHTAPFFKSRAAAMVMISFVVYPEGVITFPGKPNRRAPAETLQNVLYQGCGLRPIFETFRDRARWRPMPDKNDCPARNIHAHRRGTLRPERDKLPISSNVEGCTHWAKHSVRRRLLQP